MFYDDEFDRLFKSMSRSFVSLDDLFDDVKSTGTVCGPVCYGYTMTIGPEGKPVVKEYGNVRPELRKSDIREPLVDTLVDDKEKIVKLIAEMPGVEKNDVKIVVDGKIVGRCVLF